MTKEEVQSNNKLIAEFMGAIPNPKSPKTGCALLVRNNKKPYHYFYADLKYHKSWDWLMPVIEKIEHDLPDDSIITIEYKDCIIPVNEGEFDIQVLGEETKLLAVYKAVIEFIKWYNKNK